VYRVTPTRVSGCAAGASSWRDPRRDHAGAPGRHRSAIVPHIGRLLLALGIVLATAAPVVAYPFQLAVGVGLSEEFNDNIFFDETDEWDFITRLTLGLIVNYSSPSARHNRTLSTYSTIKRWH
jgi:hypothetical protein